MGISKALQNILVDMPVAEPKGSLGVPWIYRDPKGALKHWQNKIENVFQYSAQKLENLEAASARPGLLQSTRARLQRLSEGHQKNLQYLRGLMGSFVDAHADSQHESNLEKVPRQQSATAYQATLFRDWVWGKQQVARYASLLTPHLKDKKRLAFLGAGACGLPIAVHNEIRPELSVAVDINPLLLIPAKRLLQGEIVRLVEFPTVPSQSEYVFVDHEIKLSTPTAPGFELLFCDAQNLPAKDGSFDAVVTSWFLDIIPRDFRETARLVNVILGEGGIWTNIGQLGFEKNDLTQTYGPDEVKEILLEAGFQIEAFETHDLPYLQSPYDAVGRQDKVWAFAARKVKHAKRPATHEYWPEWITNSKLPVPAGVELRQLRVRSDIYSVVLELVDGKNSIEDIAAILSSELSIPEAEAQKSVNSFFANFFEGVVYREF